MMEEAVKTPRRLLALPPTAMVDGSHGGSGTSGEIPLEIGTAAGLYE